jgi:hypothetical protein
MPSFTMISPSDFKDFVAWVSDDHLYPASAKTPQNVTETTQKFYATCSEILAERIWLF